jgi:exodeoxyribonuclease VII large subunit
MKANMISVRKAARVKPATRVLLSRMWLPKASPSRSITVVTDDFAFDAPAAPRDEPHVFSVSEITRSVRTVLEQCFASEIIVEGEVSNYRKQASGHQYFTLKDAQSQLTCVMFARPGMWRRQAVALEEGMQIRARGRLTVYEARGQYQLSVQNMEPAGAGMLQAKFEALKRKLQAEGLFDPARKRALPPFPKVVALVTSPSGAALRDMLNIFTRRAPWLRLIIVPARVQGDGSAEEIVNALQLANDWERRALPRPDVIVVARGGGSVEDLWEFNEEIVARAIVASGIPIVSAVGHEIDFTISDFAADLRAPTPSAAAELIAPDGADLLRRVEILGARIQREVRNQVDGQAQQLDMAGEALLRGLRDRLSRYKAWLAEQGAWLKAHRPDQIIQLRRQTIAGLQQQMTNCFATAFDRRRQKLQRVADHLRLLSPDATLNRGYSITTHADGRLVRSRAEVKSGEKVVTRLSDGSFPSVAE